MMKYFNVQQTIMNTMAGALGMMFILTGCSSDDVEQALADNLIAIRGQVTSTNNPAGETGATVKAIYSDSDPLNPETSTRADGAFFLSVLKNTPASIQVSKSGSDLIVLNSAKQSSSIDISGYDVELITTIEADAAIAETFSGPTLAGFAWLAVNVVDIADNEVAGVTISTTGTPVDTAATRCDGTDSGDDVTVVDAVPCDRAGPMYFAYFDTDSAEVSVSDSSDTQLAPVRRGEVTFLEFVQ